MNIFLFDESEALGHYIAKGKPVGEELGIYWISPSNYGQAGSVDDFFQTILTENVWQFAGDARGDGKTTLVKLVNNNCKDTIFLVHVNLKATTFSARQDQEGIELLKHIRLTEAMGNGRNTHVVLYSFEEQLNLLKRKPGNLIMMSGAVSFLRLPEGLNDLRNPQKLAKLSGTRADVNRKDFKSFVQCDFQLPDAAHRFSNWWGVYKLSSVASDTGPPPYESESDPKITLRAHLLSNCKHDINGIVDKELRVLANKKALFLFGSVETPIPSCPPIIPRESSTQKLVVLHIDDEPIWTTCLRWLIYSHFVNVDYEYENKIPEKIDKDWVLENICKRSPNLLLLDLRLYGTQEISLPVKDTSGVNLAQLIRKENPGVPILLMTASNKAWVFEEMMKQGVDGYWMKEGIGEHLPPEGSVRNYNRLLELISIALGEQYQFLRRFAKSIADIKKLPSPWWLHPEWKNGEQTDTDPSLVSVVFDLLESAFVLFRESLRLFCMGYGSTGGNIAIRTSWMSAPIMEMAKVIELVHQVFKEEYRSKNRRRSLAILTGQENRGDNWGNFLNTQRNLCAHAQDGYVTIDFPNVQSFISGVLTWMLIPPNGGKRAALLEAQNEYKMINGSTTFHAIQSRANGTVS